MSSLLATKLKNLRTLGEGLVRPECVLSHESGFLFCSDWQGTGGVAVVSERGTIGRLLIADITGGLRPNGIALEPDGSFLLAHLGQTDGGIFRLFSDGSTEPVCTHVNGQPLPPCNFVVRDDAGRIWFTVSTRKIPRADDYRPSANSGFIGLIENGQARIVADSLGYTNELAVSPEGTALYVNETFARRVTRFTLAPDGSLSDKHTIAELGPGSFPDGLVLDSSGGLWVTSIVSNRVIRINEAGIEVMLEESDAIHLGAVESAFATNRMGREHLDTTPATTLRNISSLAFGGPDLKTIFLGCLLGDRLVVADAPVGGQRPVHYGANVTSLLSSLDMQ